jgi:hypothetical protein
MLKGIKWHSLNLNNIIFIAAVTST